MLPDAVHQFVPTLSVRDAVGTHTLRLRRLLREAGFESEVYAGHVLADATGQALGAHELARQGTHRKRTWLLYQFAVGDRMAEDVSSMPFPLAIYYHNVTDPRFFRRWEPAIAALLEQGRRQLAAMAGRARFALAASAFNEEELLSLGFASTCVAPPLIDLSELDADPDPGLLRHRQALADQGGHDWLCVGRLAPNKCQHDVVAAFAIYRRLYDPRARLALVGDFTSASYRDAIVGLAGQLGVEDALTLPGAVTQAELLAYYRTADLFVLLSEHEGFNVPAVESMHLGIPVIAYASSAVPDTVGDAGLLLTDKDPVLVATAADRVLSDASCRDSMVGAGRTRAAGYSADSTGPPLLRALTTLMESSDP